MNRNAPTFFVKLRKRCVSVLLCPNKKKTFVLIENCAREAVSSRYLSDRLEMIHCSAHINAWEGQWVRIRSFIVAHILPPRFSVFTVEE